MTWRVTLRANAEADLVEAHAWYDRQRAGLGQDLLAAVAEALIRLEQKPDLHPVYYRGFRRIFTRRFPYKLFYRIQGNTVIVFRILHAARDHVRQLDKETQATPL